MYSLFQKRILRTRVFVITWQPSQHPAVFRIPGISVAQNTPRGRTPFSAPKTYQAPSQNLDQCQGQYQDQCLGQY